MPLTARILVAFLVALGAVTGTVHRTAGQPQQTARSGPRIEIAFAKEARAEAVTELLILDHPRQPAFPI